MFPIIDIGPIAIQADGLVLLVSIFIGLWLTGKFAVKIGTAGEVIENCFLIGLVAGILSARVGFMLQNPSLFLYNPLSLFSLTSSMFNPGFGFLMGALIAMILAQKQHVPLWPTLDTLSPLFICLFAGFHLANFAKGTSYGLPTDLPWGIHLWQEIRHPLQLYALILTSGLLLWILIQTKGLSKTGFMHSGVLVNLVLLCLALITIFSRAFVSQKSLLGKFDIPQLVGFLLIPCTLFLVYDINHKNRRQSSVIIGIGSNKDPANILPGAINEISHNLRIRRKSSIYRTEAVKQISEGSNYWNMVIEIGTPLPYPELLSQIKTVEQQFGRRPGNKTDVPLDLDILAYSGDVFTYQGKTIPDPDLIKYRYIAQPLAEISPDFHHPADGRSIATILDKIEDHSQIEKIGEVQNGTAG